MSDFFENDDELVLQLGDLLPDDAGEVVLFARDEPLKIEADTPLIETGVVEDSHITASGTDVGGLTYSQFANGMTLYHDNDHILIIAPDV
ncbi:MULTISPECIES: hypothetical protein [Kiloniella]|uniref:Uncharacterized protein n=2 Tax=Kiloniella TaxID=454159 RepID=A0A0M2RDV1_9PROT|nr:MULTISPECIES: hypothetical protein [Kiloniella]KKJ77733.1 hypothetical protein WH95_04600 [Kiloniella litopenaei]KLN62268.1 hypothetical protein WH96_01730 [Kiloniella spongiae]